MCVCVCVCCSINLQLSLFRVHAVCVCDQAKYFYDHIDDHLKMLGLSDAGGTVGKTLKAADLINIIDGYKGRGYSLSTDEELGLVFA